MLPFTYPYFFSLRLNFYNIFWKALVILISFCSFKGITHSYLQKVLITHNKKTKYFRDGSHMTPKRTETSEKSQTKSDMKEERGGGNKVFWGQTGNKNVQWVSRISRHKGLKIFIYVLYSIRFLFIMQGSTIPYNLIIHSY